MNSLPTTQDSKQIKIISLIVPVIITCLVPILFFSALSVLQLIGSGTLLSITILSLLSGGFKDLPDKDISIIWVASILYNLYLLTMVM